MDRRCTVILIYLILLVLSIIYIPMFFLLLMLPPITIVGLMLRRTPTWVKVIVGVWLVIVAVFVLFNNSIYGPLMFAIQDRPVDIPAQFLHSWRFYWTLNYLNELSWDWGITSIIFLICYKILRKACERLVI